MLSQLQCLIMACDELKLSYSFFDDNHNAIEVETAQGLFFFVNCGTSFNVESQAQIASDKYFTYRLCKDVIRMPKSHMYIDPFVAPEYREYRQQTSYEQIVDRVLQEYSFPLIIKPNHGARGKHVFLCRTRDDISHAVATIFDQQDKDYEYIALVQVYIPTNREFRAVMFQQKLLILYEKDTTKAIFEGNLSPLHWSNARAVHILDTLLIEKVGNFLQPFFTKLPLGFVGFDVAMTQSGELSLIEANTKPGFDYFIRDNGKGPIIALYKTILSLT